MKSWSFILINILAGGLFLREATAEESEGDRMLQEYLIAETRRIEEAALAGLKTKADWEGWKTTRRGELFSMLGLDPDRERTELKPVVTETTERDGIVVENLHFQSSPGLYVTGNLYRPKVVTEKLPTVLYVCGHGGVKKDGVSFGNKVHYHHHGAWFARNGYVCLTIDTLQLGEIEGLHHGTYSHGRWDWISRGYSPAGVEAWNGIRALDYLETRKEVDADRFGVTGRSGGGAYSWYLAALDDRIKVAIPVAGITSLKDHVVGRCVDGHCDCMYMLNSARWDFSHLSALVAPRPLLIQNTDKDRIFPLGGVVDVYNKTRRIYGLLGAEENIGLCITEGGHHDTQELRVPAFRWFERFLKGVDPPPDITDLAVRVFEPEELRVFKDGLPENEVNTVIGDQFTELAGEPVVPADEVAFAARIEKAKGRLRKETFSGWPDLEVGDGLDTELVFDKSVGGVRMRAFDFTAQEPFRLRLFFVHRTGVESKDILTAQLNVMDEKRWIQFQKEFGSGFGEPLGVAADVETDAEEFAGWAKIFEKNPYWGMAFFAPRGVGLSSWEASSKRQHQVRRSFVLLGQTVAGMQVWDTRRAVEILRFAMGQKGKFDPEKQLCVWSWREMTEVATYAALFESDINTLTIIDPPSTHEDGREFVNILRVWDFPEAIAAAAATVGALGIYDEKTEPWSYVTDVGKVLGWDKNRIHVGKLGEVSGGKE